MSNMGTPIKSGYFITIGLSNVKMVADKQRDVAYRNKH